MLPTKSAYLIGETAFHHEGDLAFLKELVYNGKEIGLNAIKFHMLLDIDDYMVSTHVAIDAIRKWCFSKEQWKEVINYTINDMRLDAIILCNDVASLEWLIQEKLPVRAIELHATGINDIFLLEKAAAFDSTVILGVGGSSLDEIQYAVDFLEKLEKKDVFLMHGFQNYPTDYRDINLSKMTLLNQLFNLPVGYADHTDPLDEDNETISVLGAGSGFNVVEKHFTHQFGEKRIDSQAAVSIAQMKKVRTLLNKLVEAYGTRNMKMSDSEKKYGNTGPMKKAIVARRDIKKGEILTIEHLAFKRTNESAYIKQIEVLSLVGLEVKDNIIKDEFIDFSKLNYAFSVNDFSQFKNTKQ